MEVVIAPLEELTLDQVKIDILRMIDTFTIRAGLSAEMFVRVELIRNHLLEEYGKLYGVDGYDLDGLIEMDLRLISKAIFALFQNREIEHISGKGIRRAQRKPVVA